VAGRALGGHPALLLRELRGVAGVAGVGRLFGAVNAQLVQPLLDLAADIAPDVVVHEPLSVAGAVVAARRGAPAVLQENSLWDGAELVTATARSGPLRAAARRAAVTRLPPPVLRLVTAPPSIVGRRRGWPLRPVPWSGTGTLPTRLAQATDRPRLLLTHSTVPGPGGATHLRTALAMADGTDVEVIVARPPKGMALPPTVRTTGRIPLCDALPFAAAIVHHGGAGPTAEPAPRSAP